VSSRKTVQTCRADAAQRPVGNVTSRRLLGSAKRKKPAVLRNLRSVWKSSRLLWPHRQVDACLTLRLQLSRPPTVNQITRMAGKASATSVSPAHQHRITPLTTTRQRTSDAGPTTPLSQLVHLCPIVTAVLQRRQDSIRLQKKQTALRCHGLSQAMLPAFFTTLHLSSSFSVSIP
jgi:hypothetical protein